MKCNGNSASNHSLLSNSSAGQDSRTSTPEKSYLRTKKRPAPPIPIKKRTVRGSISEIERELDEIGNKLPELEKKGSELELLIKNNEGMN